MPLHRQPKAWLILAGILLIAANLRAPITALPPLIEVIQSDYGLSNTGAGALTALPLLAFALLSPISARLSLHWGLERTLFLALLGIAAGILWRSLPYSSALFLGTCLIGMGIAAGNVLLPGIIKRGFPNHITAITGAYAVTMGLAASLGSALVVPLAQAWGWHAALLSFLLLPVSALIVWGQACRTSKAEQSVPTKQLLSSSLPWREPLAWQITFFLGLNSTIYYIAIAWLPAIFNEQGLSAQQAGSLHGAMQLATIVPGLILSPVLRHVTHHGLVAASVALMSAVSLLGWLYAPSLALLWAVMFGIGTGAGIILGLSFIGMRTHHSQQAASLSGMSQCIGYLLAATGPLGIAHLHDITHSWHMPLLLCSALALIAAGMGYLAGTDRKLPKPITKYT